MQLRRTRLTELIASRSGAAAGASFDPSGLLIREIQAYSLTEPDSGRQYTVVKVKTASGLTGFGEGAPILQEDLLKIRPLLIGKPATAYEGIRQQLASVPGLQASVNIALLDLIGKRAGVPLYQLLGGPTRNKVRALTTLRGDSNEALITSLKEGIQSGFRAFMVALPPSQARNQGQDYLNASRERLGVLREIGGEQVDFVLAGKGLLTPGDASSLARAFERFHLLWFDEPCSLSNLAAVRKISSRTVTPLGFGSSVSDPASFQSLLGQQIVDVLRPSLLLNGITQIRKIGAMAETHYTALAPHHDGGTIGTAAALHLAASLPNFFIQQIPVPVSEADRRMRAELASTAVESVKEGFAPLPTGAGLGLGVNEEVLERYQRSAR